MPQNTWTCVVFIQNSDDLDNLGRDDTETLAEHLAQWDYGSETDDSQPQYEDIPTFATTTEVTEHVAGTEYVVQTCHNPWYVALYRPTITD